ncbi:MAG: HAD family phosphatase [bacterium]|nr:MAG: HAD family phosphatase [bacterium]
MQNTERLRRILDGTDGVIFDFDNIIVDSEPYHFEAYSRAFAKWNHVLDRKEYWREWTSKGGGAEGEIRRYNLDLDPDEVRRYKDPIYSAFCRSGEIGLVPAAEQVIRELDAAGYTLAIASGSYEQDIRAILKANGLETFFGAVVGKDGITRYKPDPETYVTAAGAIRMPPERCCAIEDAEKGIRSAKGAGMDVIIIETPITRGFDLQGADLTLGSMDELLTLLRLIRDPDNR